MHFMLYLVFCFATIFNRIHRVKQKKKGFTFWYTQSYTFIIYYWWWWGFFLYYENVLISRYLYYKNERRMKNIVVDIVEISNDLSLYALRNSRQWLRNKFEISTNQNEKLKPRYYIEFGHLVQPCSQIHKESMDTICIPMVPTTLFMVK